MRVCAWFPAQALSQARPEPRGPRQHQKATLPWGCADAVLLSPPRLHFTNVLREMSWAQGGHSSVSLSLGG